MRVGMNRGLLLSLALVFVTGTGCTKFYSVRPLDEGRTHVTFDERLPRALAEVSNTCLKSLALAPGMAPFDLTGTCRTPGDLPTIDGQNLFAAMGAAPKFDPMLTTVGTAVTGHVSSFLFPFQHCNVTYELAVKPRRLNLNIVGGRWILAQDDFHPALQLELQAPTVSLVSFDLTARRIFCVTPTATPTLAAALPRKVYDVSADGLRIQLSLELLPKTSAGVQTRPVVTVSLGTMSVENDPFQRMVRADQAKIEAALADYFTGTLGALTGAMDAFVNGAVAAQRKGLCNAILTRGEANLLTVTPQFSYLCERGIAW